MRRAIQVIIVAAMALVGATRVAAVSLPSPQKLIALVPGAASAERVLKPVDHWRLADARGNLVGAAFITSSVPPPVSGYRGEIDVLVGMRVDGTITVIEVVGHGETVEFMQRIIGSGFLEQFLGRRGGADFSDIHAVTGATISSEAIRDDVQTAATAVAREIRGEATTGGVVSTMSWRPVIGGGAVLMLAILATLAALRPRRRWLRWAALGLSIAVIGFWLNAPISLDTLVDLRSGILPGWSRLPLIILLIFAFLACLLRGNLYCCYLCPFGALQEGLARLPLPTCRPTERLSSNLRWLRWVVLIVAIYGIAALGSFAFRTIEPFALCFAWPPPTPVIVLTGIVFVAALFVRRVWCRFLCPTGLVLDLIALVGAKLRHALHHRSRRKDVPTCS